MVRNQIIKVSPAFSKAADSKGRAFGRRPQSAKLLSVQALAGGKIKAEFTIEVIGGMPASEASPLLPVRFR